MYDDCDSRSIFAQRITHLRKMSHMTQQELSDKLHMDRSTYAYYETGKTTPNFDTLQRIARVFAVSVDFLLGNTDDIETTSVHSPELLSPMDGALMLARLPEDERSFLMLFRQLNSEQRDALQAYALSLSNQLPEND
jgi:transcriptional regulator with XRE-family HTH domain